MALQRECAVCGGRFTAQRSTAKYCSGRCRVRATRAPTPAPERRENAALLALVAPHVALPAPPAEGEGLVATTERELRAAERFDTSLGQAAMYLARTLESGGSGQTGASIASLIREHRATLTAAVAGSEKTDNPLHRLRQRDQERRATTA